MLTSTWIAILWMIIRYLGPVIASFLQAQITEFEKKNPKWRDGAVEGLALLKNMGLAVIAETSSIKFPDNQPDAERNEILRNEGIRRLSARAHDRGLNLGENDIRRTLEEAYTAWKAGERYKA